jgi:nucleotide-binding universal stress UspA family protein
MFKRILVPLDGSEQAEEVLPWASMLAEFCGAEIVLLRIAEYPYQLYSMCYECPPHNSDLEKEIQEKKKAIYIESDHYLNAIASKLATAGLKATPITNEGPVIDAILACTRRLQIDLIILATYGQSGGSYGFIGTVANRVLREAQVPVVMIRPTPHSFISGFSLLNQLTHSS